MIAKVTTADIPYDARTPLRPLETALQEETRRVAGFAHEVLTRMKGQSSKTRGCSTCGSAIAVAYMKVRPMREGYPRTTIACPVCETEDFCLSETDRKRHESLMKGHDKARERLSAAEAKLAQSFAKPIWYALGWNRD